MVIYKQELKVTDLQTIYLPKDAKILTIQAQNNKPCIWFLCHPSSCFEEARTFAIYGTGNPVNEEAMNYKYVGTLQLDGGKCVLHVFEF